MPARNWAAAALGDLGGRAHAAAAALAAAAHDEEFCYTACGALARIEPAHPQVSAAMTRLEAVLAAPDWRKRLHAVAALRMFGTVAVGLLVRAVGDPDQIVRSQAVYELGEIGAPARRRTNPASRVRSWRPGRKHNSPGHPRDSENPAGAEGPL